MRIKIKSFKGVPEFFFYCKRIQELFATRRNKREERWEMEKKERNIGVSGGWGGSVVGVKEPYRRPMINNFCEVVRFGG